MSRCSFCSRRRSLGRRLRAPRIIGWCTARPPSTRSVPSGFPLRAPPARWYTGRARPADGRQPHARRARSLHGSRHASPLELVSSSCTRAGDTHGGRATVATAQRNMYFGHQKSRPPEWCKHSSERPDHAPRTESEWSLCDCDGACTIRSIIVPRIMQDVKPPACKIGPLALAFHTPAAATAVKAGPLARLPWPCTAVGDRRHQPAPDSP